MREPYTQLYIHLVWSTFDREPMLKEEHRSRIYGCIQAECKKLKVATIAIGGTDDHVHLFGRLPSTISISDLAKQVKGSSSHFANNELGMKDVFRWQEGYGAFTVSKSLGPTVKAYILRQEQHHNEGTTDKDFEIAFAERDDTQY